MLALVKHVLCLPKYVTDCSEISFLKTLIEACRTIHDFYTVMTLEPSIVWFEAIVSNKSELSYLFRPQRHYESRC
jgi:hypothetical protein